MTSSMTTEQIAAYVDAASVALGLHLSPDHRPGVLRYFALAATFADIVDAVALEPHHESAMVFIPANPAPSGS